MLEDLIVTGQGLALVERTADAAEVGGPVQTAPGQLPIAIVPNGDVVVSLQRE